jgi:phage baseplate assembly protein W
MALPVKPDFLGRGWAFPPAFSKAGHSVALVEDSEDIRQSLYILLHTSRGERVMVPTYGCDLWKYVFRTVTTSLLTELREVVRDAIEEWEQRIDLLDIQVTAPERQAGRVDIDISFRERITNVAGNLVFPFYLADSEPAEGG